MQIVEINGISLLTGGLRLRKDLEKLNLKLMLQIKRNSRNLRTFSCLEPREVWVTGIYGCLC